MNRRICTVLAVASLALGLAACEEDIDPIDETGCESAADCTATQVCEIPEGATAGVCEEVVAADCTSDDVCGDYTCDLTAGTCATSCEDDTTCSGGNICGDASECRAIEYRYIAIMSETTSGSDDVTMTNTPGPDIDAIELSQGGTSYYAAVVESSLQGAGGNPDNANGDVTALIGANDVVLGDGSDCPLTEDQGFWSMGDISGFVIVSLDAGIAIEDGAALSVYELAGSNCPNISTVRDDNYTVLIGLETIDVAAITSAGMITGQSWLTLGASAATGGTFESTIAIAQ